MAVWESSRVSAVVTLAPLMTLLFAQLLWFFLPDPISLEPLNVWSWVGAILVVAGSTAAALAGTRNTAD